MTKRARTKFDYFPLYFWDFEKDTEHMTDACKMGYLRVLAHIYQNGGYIPDGLESVKNLARFAGKRGADDMAKQVRKLLTTCFVFVDNTGRTVIASAMPNDNNVTDVKQMLTQPRALEIVRLIEKKQRVNKERASKAARKRWGWER